MMDYTKPRNVRRESRTITGRFRGGKLNPVMATAVRGNEGGMLAQTLTLELDPVMGRLITPITGEMVSVFVPVQAMHALAYPQDDYAGLTDVIRAALLTGNPLFQYDNEGELSQRMGVVPKAINGTRRVSSTVKLAHNAAVNLLRLEKYHKAPMLLASNNTVTPALIDQTVLDRLGGVLDPDDHINGSVQLQMPTMRLPVEGVAVENSVAQLADVGPVRETGDAANEVWGSGNGLNKGYAGAYGTTVGRRVFIKMNQTAIGASPEIYARMSGEFGGDISLADFYNAETMDRLTRDMQEIIKANPQYGEEMVLRMAHGLSVDVGKVPFVIARKKQVFGRSMVGATDGAGIAGDVMRSDMMLQMSFSVPIPRTELGGVIVTFAVVKPDETLPNQPHPILADQWGVDTFVADELVMDPQRVQMRDLDSEVPQANEASVAFYTGLHELHRNYVNYGFARNLDRNTVTNKTAIWQLEIPVSVTPENILYPVNLPHYPFADQLAEVVTYTVGSMLTVQTPKIFGPSPVEKLDVIGQSDLFDEVP